ncbi:MAG: 30S ribosomal protein S17 [Calditrichaeota bacterium]|jgi:small subunit ribosomal protein S17|nr:30S ribosomal protein S17 [Calditrichota bacterium]MBT7616507.1 30S ribosomal protein S17 [Calditrichota bacterium]MBT7787349.1 30S ribosomal protein S17 [Calditrichota bacterium]
MERENRRKVQQGVVTSDSGDKSITVLVERKIPHPVYKKYFKRSKKFMAHDAENTCNVGDFVRIIECRPLSKRKSWRLLSVIERKA